MAENNEQTTDQIQINSEQDTKTMHRMRKQVSINQVLLTDTGFTSQHTERNYLLGIDSGEEHLRITSGTREIVIPLGDVQDILNAIEDLLEAHQHVVKGLY